MSDQVEDDDQSAGVDLLEVGGLVDFDILEQDVELVASTGRCRARIELKLKPAEGDPENDKDVAAWGAHGFIFFVCVLSFAEAMPLGTASSSYDPNDRFGVADLFAGLRFERDGLTFHADYVRGRRMQTDVIVRADARATIRTVDRGQEAIGWLSHLSSG